LQQNLEMKCENNIRYGKMSHINWQGSLECTQLSQLAVPIIYTLL